MTFEEMLQRYAKENQGMVCEPPAYLLEKQQGEYTVEDFLRLPEGMMVEMVDGVLYNMAYPTNQHELVVSELQYVFMDYIKKKGGKCTVTRSRGVFLDKKENTTFKPDLMVVCGKENLNQNGYFGAPDLIIEVLSPSTEEFDKTVKFNRYKQAGVREYWMIDLKREVVMVYEFANNKPVMLFGFKDVIPVNIYSGDLEVDFAKIMEAVNIHVD